MKLSDYKMRRSQDAEKIAEHLRQIGTFYLEMASGFERGEVFLAFVHSLAVASADEVLGKIDDASRVDPEIWTRRDFFYNAPAPVVTKAACHAIELASSAPTIISSATHVEADDDRS